MASSSEAAGPTAAPEEYGNAESRLATYMGWILLALAAALYFATLDTGLSPSELEVGDLITHQYAQVKARPSNAPGYPLYTMGGWLWFHGVRTVLALFGNPLPNPMPILSSYSTIWALLSLWLLYRILLHLSRSAASPRGNWPLAWTISAFYAVTFSFWHYATTTEQYCSAVAQTLALVYLYLLWEEATSRKSAATRRRGEFLGGTWLLLVMAFLCGLTLAHLVTVAVIVPPLLLAVLRRQPDLLHRPRLMLGAVLSAGVPLISYLYIYLRGVAHPEWRGQGDWASAQEWFWNFISTNQGREELSWGLQAGAPFSGNGFPQLMWQELSEPILLLGLAGSAMLRGGTRLLVWGTLILYLALSWVDRFGNWYQVIMPAYPLLLLGILPVGLFVQKNLIRVSPLQLPKGGKLSIQTIAPILLLLGAAGWSLAVSWPAADSRGRTEDTALVRPTLLLSQQLPAGIGLFGEHSDALGLDYLVSIWGVRPDLTVLSSHEAGHYLASGRSVAATWQSAPLLLSELSGETRFEVQGIAPDWVLLMPEGSSERLTEVKTNTRRSVGDGVLLAAYRTDESDEAIAQLASGCDKCLSLADSLDVTLFWQVEGESSPGDWAISVRASAGGKLLTQDGEMILQDRSGPVHGLRPFSTILPGQIVIDSYRLPAARSADSLHIIVYRRGNSGFENLAELDLPLR